MLLNVIAFIMSRYVLMLLVLSLLNYFLVALDRCTIATRYDGDTFIYSVGKKKHAVKIQNCLTDKAKVYYHAVFTKAVHFSRAKFSLKAVLKENFVFTSLLILSELLSYLSDGL